jgi:siroheme synthase
MIQANVSPQVTLIGAGPGDPELLAIEAVKALRRASVALVDDLVNPGVLRYLKRSARIIHVGKRGGCASTPQAFIHRLMIAEARRGERVVRLKGGDPFVFGPDWASLVRSGLTLVVCMGVARADRVVQSLLDAGMAAATPAAVISAAHTPQQCHARCTLGTLLQTVHDEALASPAVLVIGEVAALGAALSGDERTAVLHALGDMGDGDAFGAGQVGHGARDLQHAVHGAR